jgi:uncharacterized protein
LIIYLDTSALVKTYVHEYGSNQVISFINSADVIGTSKICKAEMAAALAMAERRGALTLDQAREAWEEFLADWRSIYKLTISDLIIDMAATIAWERKLRGYDAIHLATALSWKDALGEMVVLATYDRQLWMVTEKAGLSRWPESM